MINYPDLWEPLQLYSYFNTFKRSHSMQNSLSLFSASVPSANSGTALPPIVPVLSHFKTSSSVALSGVGSRGVGGAVSVETTRLPWP